MKIILTMAGAIVFLGLLGGAGYIWKGRSAAADDAIPVRIEPATRGDLVEVVSAPAEVQPKNKVSISAKVSARIVEMPVKEGDRVKAGDLLLKLDSRDLDAALRSSQARYDAQKAGITVEEARIDAQISQLDGLRRGLTEAKRDLERQRGLLASHDVSQSIVDTAEQTLQERQSSLDSAVHSLDAEKTNLEVLRHNMEAAKADITLAEENVSYATIESPIDGIVTTINAKVGELVMTGTMNNPGTVVLEVADLSQMIAQARVDETDVANVEVNQSAKVHMMAYPDETFEGTVTSVALARSTDRNASSGSSSGDSKVFKVEVLLNAQSRRIPSGLTADVDIQTRRNKNVIRVPTQAVLGKPTDSLPAEVRNGNPNIDTSKTIALVVFRVVDGKAIITPVSVGAADNTDTMIRAGLSDGDLIVTGPYKALEQLTHNQKVKDESPTTKPSTTRPAADVATATTMPASTQPVSSARS